MNKLIILFNFSGSYKGGAQKRYLTLFKYLQATSDDFYLLINSSLYESCMEDGILESDKNIIFIPIRYQKKAKNQLITKRNDSVVISPDVTFGVIRKWGGEIKYFIKCFFSCFEYSIRLYRIIRKYKFSSAYTVFTGGIWSWFLLKIIRLPFIYSYNDSNFSMLNPGILKCWSSEYWVVKYANKVDCLSTELASGILKRIKGLKEKNLCITPNSFIDYSKFYPVYPKENIITFCARLEILKNPVMLVEACAKIKDRLGDYKVYIIGEGREEPLLRKLVDKYELEEKVILTGGISHPFDILSKSKIFISIQQFNNYPSQSLMEAMACENAIIASDVGETSLMLSEKEAMLIPLNINSLSKALLFLINHPEDCQKIGKAARLRVMKDHSVENFIKYVKSLF